MFTMEGVTKLNLSELQQIIKHVTDYHFDEVMDKIVREEPSDIIYEFGVCHEKEFQSMMRSESYK
jgi:hypothetical protein